MHGEEVSITGIEPLQPSELEIDHSCLDGTLPTVSVKPEKTSNQPRTLGIACTIDRLDVFLRKMCSTEKAEPKVAVLCCLKVA